MNDIKDFESPRTDIAWNEAGNNNTMLHVVLKLIDMNDNAPTFTKKIYEAGKTVVLILVAALLT